MKPENSLKDCIIFGSIAKLSLVLKEIKLFTQKFFAKKNIDTRPCKKPFECFEIHRNGNVFTCCPDFLKGKFSVGNIEKQDFHEIWNGKILTDLRKRMLKGDFSKCNRNICCIYEPYPEGEIPADYEKGPKDIKISYDFECNYKCITCRDEIRVNTSEKLELFDNVYLPKIIKASKNAKILSLLGSGEPLFSKHSKNLLQKLVKDSPDIKIHLFTNGLYAEEETLRELGILNNIQGFSVSLDAATRETYKKIRGVDAFEKVIKNLEVMSEWKKQGKIEWVTINFVVHLLNYKEMPAFVELAQKLDIMALFSTYRPWKDAKFYKRYREIAVFERKNKYYDDLVRILKNPIFQDKAHCSLEPRLFDMICS